VPSFRQALNRMGRLYAKGVFESFYEGRISASDLSRCLGLEVKTPAGFRSRRLLLKPSDLFRVADSIDTSSLITAWRFAYPPERLPPSAARPVANPSPRLCSV